MSSGDGPGPSTKNLRYYVGTRFGHFQVRDLEGKEGLSSPFRFEAKLLVSDDELFDPYERVGGPARIVLERDGEVLRRVVGVLSEASLGATAGGKPEMILVVEPRWALLREKADARVFCDKSVPQIVEEVLNDGKIPFKAVLKGRYAKRPYCVQYAETDFAFVSRLLEDEGIFYTFLEDEDGTMLLADAPTAYEPIPGHPVLRFGHAAGIEHTGESVHAVGLRAALAPSRVHLRDWNPDKPRLDMDVSAKGPTPAGVEFYDFPGEFVEPDEGRQRAHLISESMAFAAAAVHGKSDCARLAPGRTFRLLDGPVDVPEGDYAIRSIEHAFSLDASSFEVSFEALEAEATFRPPRETPVTQITNPLTGIVTGPDGEDIHTDELGRVKVFFPWDCRGQRNDRASHFIPVLQDNTGHSVGIPRIGWEVVVNFMEGDPDRPVVLGRVYNGADPFPEALPANKTRSALQSLSSPGRGGSNQIRFEDKAGAEQIYMQAEKDQNVVVANDKTEDVLATELNTVTGNEVIQIGGSHAAKVAGDRSMTIEGSQSLKVGGSRARKVGAQDKEDVGGSRSLTVGATHHRKIGGYDSTRAKTISEKVGGVDLEASLKPNKTSAGKAMTLTVGALYAEITAKDKRETAKMLRVETIGGLLFTKAGTNFKVGSLNRTTTVGGAIKVTGAIVSLNAVGDWKAEALIAALEGATSVKLKVGTNMVTLSGGEINIDCQEGDVTLQASGQTKLASPMAKLNS